MPRFDDFFAQSFNKSFSPDTAMTLAFNKWKESQDNDPQKLLQKNLGLLMMVNPEMGAALLAKMSGGQGAGPAQTPQGSGQLSLAGNIPQNPASFPQTNMQWKSPLLEQTQESKINQELWQKQQESNITQKMAVQKSLAEEDAKAGSAIALLNGLKRDYLVTKPPQPGALGIGGSGILPQPFYGIQSRIGSELQITPNQRADRTYVRKINSLRSRLAKGVIGNDVGNLSTYEQSAASGGLGALTDVKSVGVGMFDSAIQLVKDMKEARKAGFKSLDEKLRAEGRVLTPDIAQEYLRKANGDKEKARQMAIQDRWAF